MNDRKTCGAARVMAPREVRWCHLDPDHEGRHETIFRSERVTWADGDEGTA